ncbi:MAG: peptidylprolyl isomerase [Gemmatimonadaceae bacterium]
MRRPLLLQLAILGALAVPAAAQDAPPLGAMLLIDVDRIVAVVAKRPILYSEVLEQVNLARARGLEIPRDSAGQMAIARDFLSRIVDEEVLVTVAKEYDLVVTEIEVGPTVDRSIEDIRARFPSEAEFRDALRREGYGTPEEYRRRSIEVAIRQQLQGKAMDTLRALGRVAPVNVTEREVVEAFERAKAQLGPRPATVAFRQLAIKPQPRAESRLAARRLIDSLRVAIDRGAEFEEVARTFSRDGSAAQGGDLGWSRRGRMVPAFDQMMFALLPGRVSPVVETEYGFHLIRVDRVRPGEVRARHILITPALDTADVQAARVRADSALAAWKAGVPFDTLVARYHDPSEERAIPDGVPVDSLPVEYRLALRNLPTGAFSEVFSVPDPVTGFQKWLVAQVVSALPAGEYTLGEFQERVRQQLKEEKSVRRTLDILRREYYVALRL